MNTDILIAGGGLAGLTLALQLQGQHPDLEIAVLEPTERPLAESAHKVGESSVELGTHYLAHTLGLQDYLDEHHIYKYGLRFFPGGGERPFEERREVGPSIEPVVPSFQMDRGVLENDLRAFVEDAGITLLEGAQVRDVDLREGDEDHRVQYLYNDTVYAASTRWFFDATGRHALLRRHLKSGRRSRHEASAGWFRVRGRVDLNAAVPKTATEWHDNPGAAHRWRSTNHLMGHGYWAWTIPLSTGNTSIGLVVHDKVHGFQTVRTHKQVVRFLEEHEPHLMEHLREHEVLDFHAIRRFSHTTTRCFSADRWGIVGEAAAFTDPLYSLGTDLIALANVFAGEIVTCDLRGGDVHARAQELNVEYHALLRAAMRLYTHAAPVYGHADAMSVKLYWDNFWYWSFPCQYFFQNIYTLGGHAHRKFQKIGREFGELSDNLQSLVTAWAESAPSRMNRGFQNMSAPSSWMFQAHLALQRRMTAEDTLRFLEEQLQKARALVGEFLIRTLFTVGDAHARTIVEKLDIHTWNVDIETSRIHAEDLKGRSRDESISEAAYNVECMLGRHPANASTSTVRTLVEPLLSSSSSAQQPRRDTPVDTHPPSAAESPRMRMLRMIGGKWITATLSAAATLGLVGAFDGKAASTATLAQRCGADPERLQRLLSTLHNIQVVEYGPDGTYQLTELGRCLHDDQLGGLARYAGAEFSWNPWSKLADAITRTQSAFEIEHGESLFSYLKDHPEDAEIYHRGVDAFTLRDAANLVHQFPMRESTTIMDLGGGFGSLLLEVLNTAPSTRGILFDLPEVIERTHKRPEFRDLGDRVQFISGDFLQNIEACADIIILKRVLHNWNDVDAKTILKNIHGGLRDRGGRLLIIDTLLLPETIPDIGRFMDLEMMVMCDDGRERSKPAFRHLLHESGFRLETTGALDGNTRWMVAAPIDSPAS